MKNDSFPPNIEAVIFDVDGGIKDNVPTADYVGTELAKRELLRLRFDHVYKAWKGRKEVKKAMEEHENEKEAYGLEKFFEVVGSTIKLDRSTLNKLTKKVIKKYEVPDFTMLNYQLRMKGLCTFLSTVGYDEIGYARFKPYNLLAGDKVDGFVANPIVWSLPDNRGNTAGKEVVYADAEGYIEGEHIAPCNSIAKGCLIPIKTSEDKRKANVRLIEAVGIDKENVAYVGNDNLDHSSMLSFGFPIASPLADEETVRIAKERNGIHLENYDSFLKLLKGSLSKRL